MPPGIESETQSFLLDFLHIQLGEMADSPPDTIRAHWRCFVACGIIVLSPFQYGLDFGLIGGLQAMPGFLKVSSRTRCTSSTGHPPIDFYNSGLWLR